MGERNVKARKGAGVQGRAAMKVEASKSRMVKHKPHIRKGPMPQTSLSLNLPSWPCKSMCFHEAVRAPYS